MTQNSSNAPLSQPALCPVCCEMFGSHLFDSMCSKCFRQEKARLSLEQNNKTEQKQETKVQENAKKQKEMTEMKLSQSEVQQQSSKFKRQRTSLDLADAVQTQPKNVCFTCSKKTGMLGYACSHCSHSFCKSHRLPEQHSCSVDFIGLGRKKLKVDLTAVVHGKIQKL